jgi:CheY-like chemotaxis protein
MVVDDSEIVLDLTKTALENAGYVVLTHNRPAGCVAMILHEKPDLLLIDVNMPRLGGDTVVKLFGRAKPNSDTIVLLYSSLPVDALRAKAQASGAHGFIRKTEDTFDLVRQVNRWLKQGAASSGRMKAAPVVEVTPEDAVQERTSGTRRVAERLGIDSEQRVEALVPPRAVSGAVALDLPTVLFVDDDMLALSAYRREVQSEGLSIEFALSGTQALRRIVSPNPPDLVVCDVLMPDPGGQQVYLRAIAANPSWTSRFIFITGAVAVQGVADFLASFGGPILYKPIEGEQLRSIIRQRLSMARTGAVRGPRP